MARTKSLRLAWGFAAIALSCPLALSAASASEPIRVGAAKVSVTPDASVFPYAASTAKSLNTGPGEKPFVDVHDEIFARAIVVGDGARRLILVSLEVTAVPSANEIIQAISERMHVPASQIVVAATHTHSVPLFSYSGHDPSPAEQREIARLKDGAVEAVDQASQHMQPAQIAFGRGTGWVNINNGEEAGSKAGYDPLGPSDKTLAVIRFDTPGGAPIALIVNYASHAEVMFRSVTKAGGYEVTGDIPGIVSHLLETQPGVAQVVMFTSAAEADQLSVFKSLQPNGDLPPTDAGSEGWGLLQAQSRRLANSVLATMKTMPLDTPLTFIRSGASTVTCPGQRLHIDAATGSVTTDDAPPVPIPLAMIQLNQIALGAVGGDVATEIGQAFKSASPVKDSLMVTMAGDSVGYIFADASYIHPGHGLTKSPLKPHCAQDAIVHGLINLTAPTPEP